MGVVNFIGIGLALFLSFLLLIKKDKGTFDYILLSWLLLNAAMLFFYYLNFIGQTQEYVPFLIALGLIPYLISPLLFIYVSSLVQGPRFSWLMQSIHFLPYLIMLASILYYYWQPSEYHVVKVSEGYINIGGRLPFHVKNWSLIMAFSACLYPLLCLHKLFKHRTAIENEFSNLQEKTLDWMRYWIIIEFVFFWISFLIINAGDRNFIEIIISFKVIAGMIIFNVFVVGFFGVRQSNIFVGSRLKESNLRKDEKYRHSNLNSLESSKLLDELKERMKSEQWYKNASLNAAEVASGMGVSKHQLSQLINEKTEGNFYEFINGFRISEFQERLKAGEADKLTLLGLAFDCGFNSKSTFNHLFKKRVGMTPSEFRKKIT